MKEYVIEEKGETYETIEFKPILIEQKENKYNLDIKVNSEGNNISLSINDKNQFPPVYYNNSMNLKQIKNLNKAFNTFSTFNDFYNYLISLSDKKKLNIQKEKDKLSIINQDIKIDLFVSKKDLEFNIKDIYEELINIKKEIGILKKENIELKKRIDILEKDNQKLSTENKSLKNGNEITSNDSKENKAEKIATEICYEIQEDFPSFEEIINKNEVIEKLLNNNYNKQITKKQIKDEINYFRNIKNEKEKIYYKLCKRKDVAINKVNKDIVLSIIGWLYNDEEKINEFFKKVKGKDNIEKAYQILIELEEEYGISGFCEFNYAINKIIDLNCDKDKICEWFENELINGL